jgi:hypothetical protein
MRSLWTRIGLGAAGVFVAGMLLLTVVKEAKSAASSALNSAVLSSVQKAAKAGAAPEMPFRLEGVDLGTIQRLVVQRQVQGSLPEVDIDVSLSDAASLDRLEDCDLVPVNRGALNLDHGFTCGDAGAGGLLTVGEATFHPGGLRRPIRVPRRMEHELRDGNAFKAKAESGGDVRVEAQDKNGAMVQVQADSHGASIKLNDALGRALVRMFADSTGASIRVRGKDGRDIVHMEAGQGGFTLIVDTSAAR